MISGILTEWLLLILIASSILIIVKSCPFNLLKKVLSSNLSGVIFRPGYKISDKKSYEVVGGMRTIVSLYGEKFVVMECNIQNGH